MTQESQPNHSSKIVGGGGHKTGKRVWHRPTVRQLRLVGLRGTVLLRILLSLVITTETTSIAASTRMFVGVMAYPSWKTMPSSSKKN